MQRTTAGRSIGEFVVAALGVVYLLVGLVGFAVTGDVGFAATEGDELLGIFEINPLHNLVHLGIGAALLGAFFAGARAVVYVAGAIGAVYLLVGVIGPFVVDTEANILALNVADHILHIGSGIVLVWAAFDVSRRGAPVHHEAS